MYDQKYVGINVK